MAHVFTKTILLCLSAYGWFALFGFGYKNGSLSMISSQRVTGCVGDACVPFEEVFTGIPRIDQHLAVLLTFFWPVVDGSRVDASLHSFYFAAQGIAIWMATLIEGLRVGNKRRMVSFSTTFGLLFQAIGMAVVGPIFLFIHLVTSPTASLPSIANLSVDVYELQALPYSTITGFIIPTILMSLHAPTYITFELKMFFVRLWQLFPILCYVSQHFWKRALRLVSNPKASDKQTRLRLLGKVYFFGVFCAAAGHVGTWMLSLTAYLFPSLFSKDWVQFLLPVNVFLPPMPWSDVKADSIGTGAHWFLQWDEILTSTMYLLWACSLTIRARKQNGRSSGIVADVCGLLGSALLVGPAGAALFALAERDDIVFTNGNKRPQFRCGTTQGGKFSEKQELELQRLLDRHFESREDKGTAIGT